MITINVDTSALEGLMGLGGAVTEAASEMGQDLAAMVHSKAKELASQKLHSRREKYIGGLIEPKFMDGAWVVALDAKVRWIDDGQDEFSMLKSLLGAKAKNIHTDKKGNRYVVVPFDHGPGHGPTNTTPANMDLVGTIRSELKKRGIPFGKLEMGSNGEPKIGMVHKFTIPGAPLKTKEGGGQGHGPIGQVRQGNTGIPFLQNVQIYQKPDEKSGKMKRTILTFRIASEKHREQGKWEHPGNAPVEILEEALNWALETWERDIAPGILDKVISET